jgi:hypothetical protein
VPARIAQASSPFVFGLCLERWDVAALWLTSVLGVGAFAALLWVARLDRRPGR